MDLDRLLRTAGSVGITPAEVVALVILLAGAGSATAVLWWSGRPAADPPPATPSGQAATAGGDDVVGGVLAVATPDPGASTGTSAAVPGTVVVDVAGLVVRPGLVELPAGSRVDDALRRAGGVLPGADTTLLNLARPLVDGEQVLVTDGTAPPPSHEQGGGVGQPGADGPARLPDGRLDLNRATSADLQALPGIGPVTAERILTHRDQRGGFTDLVELLEVPGIGPARFADLETLVGV